MREHPLYSNEQQCASTTDALLMCGQTVFQIFQMPDNEQQHSQWLLRIADPKRRAQRVLSLGCGVGGMEAYWKEVRPELSFELVNASRAQLDRLVCDGEAVRADAETYVSSTPPFDLVVVAYLLGHVHSGDTLRNALRNLAPDGTLLVYDVFNGTEEFCSRLYYQTPCLAEIEQFGVFNELRFRYVIEGGIPLGSFFRETQPWVTGHAIPGLFVFQKQP